MTLCCWLTLPAERLSLPGCLDSPPVASAYTSRPDTTQKGTELREGRCWERSLFGGAAEARGTGHVYQRGGTHRESFTERHFVSPPRRVGWGRVGMRGGDGREAALPTSRCRRQPGLEVDVTTDETAVVWEGGGQILSTGRAGDAVNCWEQSAVG